MHFDGAAILHRASVVGSIILFTVETSFVHSLLSRLLLFCQANFIEVVKVVDMARIPVIKAIAVCDAGVGDEKNSTVKFDITIDGPTHTGVAANGFVSYLADHLPNLVPLTLVLKSLLQVKANLIVSHSVRCVHDVCVQSCGISSVHCSKFTPTVTSATESWNERSVHRRLVQLWPNPDGGVCFTA